MYSQLYPSSGCIIKSQTIRTQQEDRQEESERAHLVYKEQQLCWQRLQNRQLKREYTVPTVAMPMYTSTNSCV